ncbi:iron transporter [Streptomyces noursei]|uniref:iron transporter n=1 Tax=Streptomyces noursei TaxID=1971 RepID=UPI00045EE316|nr:iron transporter [Streptomyces noursei]AIA03130.1 hypothetical protein DC74_2628 [Streptomyces noursei]
MNEYPIDKPHTINGMELSAAYRKPTESDPSGLGLRPREADMRLLFDCRALMGNKNGFAVGDFIPYLTVSYELSRHGTEGAQKGHLDPLVDSNSLHYSTNVKTQGTGHYLLRVTVAPPPEASLLRDTSKEAGVGSWFKPFNVSFNFKF